MRTREQIEKVKQTPITDFLLSIGISPVKRIGRQLVYRSPKTNENTPSFYVDPEMNRFKDFSGKDKGGDVILLVQYLTGCNFLNAVERLEQMGSLSPVASLSFSCETSSTTPSNGPQICSVRPLQHPALISYLESRGIAFSLAFSYLKEVHYLTNGKPYFAAGFENDKGGFELRSRFFKGSTSPKWHRTFVDAQGADKVCLFEGFFDFLSALQFFGCERSKFPVVVLNSTVNLTSALPTLQKFSQVNAFLDNDKAGCKSIASLISSGLNVVNYSEKLFPLHKDFNEFLCSQRS